jgi:hypothetical protein
VFSYEHNERFHVSPHFRHCRCLARRDLRRNLRGRRLRAEQHALYIHEASFGHRCGRQAVKRRRLSLGWVDFLVIAASVLTFAAVAGAAIGYS